MPKKKTNRVPRKRVSKKKGGFLNSKFVKLGFIILLFLGTYGYLKYKSHGIGTGSYVSHAFSLKRTRDNYGSQLENYGRQFKISNTYLKALVTLECSGRTDFTPRFEKHVFEQLKRVRDGRKKNYGSITKKIIGDASDEALTNLATSWGPFQLMGYQCIPLGVNISDIRGKDAIYWGVYWINKRYGKYLEKGLYRDAFHIHNTGQPFPKNNISQTYDPNYIDNGLKFMEYFEHISYE